VIGADRNSGLNTLTAYDGNTDYLVEGCQLNTVYKYICENTTQQIEAYRRRWKDTSLVPPFTVYVFRMRWASNTYDPKVRKYPYFNIPEDEIIEFPGYLYHCHILPHEDNEMMRPIMLSHSDRYLQEA
jgi:FtsP/CotA-like multicopper oxidase with cupredoxin domain